MLIRESDDRLSASQCLKDSWFSYLTSPLFKRTTSYRHSDDDSPSLPNKTQRPLKSTKLNSMTETSKPSCDFEILKCLSSNSVYSYTKRVNGDEFYCIDSDE